MQLFWGEEEQEGEEWHFVLPVVKHTVSYSYSETCPVVCTLLESCAAEEQENTSESDSPSSPVNSL